MTSTTKLLSEVAIMASGGTPNRKNKDYWNGDIPWVTTAEVSQYQYILDTKEKITELGLQNSSAKLFQEGSILLALYGQGKTRGKVALLGIPATTNQACLAIKPDNTLLKTKYLYYYLENSYEKLRKMANSGGQDNLSMAILKEFPINFPDLSIQEYRVNLFDKLNLKIKLQQEKIDLLKEHKKGFMQKMFPKAGDSQPGLRFDGFTGDWIQKNLGEHAKFRRGSFPQPYGNKEWYDGEGAMPFVQVVDVSDNLTLVENTKQKISVLAQPNSVFVPKGKVIVTLQGSIGRVAITQYDSYVDRTLLIFEDYQNKTDEYFWAYTIQQKFEIEKLKAPGGTIKTITKEALSSFEVYLPNYDEQQKIGSFFKKLDDTIALHKQKLELYVEQKQAFMQQMFI